MLLAFGDGHYSYFLLRKDEMNLICRVDRIFRLSESIINTGIGLN